MYNLNPEQTALIAELSKLADTSIAPYAAQVDEQARFPKEAMDALAKGGWYGLIVPVEYGGKGQSMRVAAAALDEIAQRDASAAMVFLMHLCGTACYVASPKGHEDTLRAVAQGKHLATLAWSERGSRSHFWAPVSQAIKENGNYRIDAQKSFVTSAGYADGYVVSARTPDATGPTDTMLYLVLGNDAGIKASGTWNSLGMRGNASSPMVLENLVIPAARALSDPSQGFPRMLEILPWFSVGTAAISTGISEAATAATIGHLIGTRHEEAGTRLADLPNLRARVAQMRIETDRSRAQLVSTLNALETGAPTALLYVLEAKAGAAESAMRVTEIGMQACGGAAYAKRLPVERNFRDARAASIMAPTTDVLYDFIGRALCGMDLF